MIFKSCENRTIIVVHEQFQYKLNYFLFCWKFEIIIIIICAEILIIIIKSNSEILFSGVCTSDLPLLELKNLTSLDTLKLTIQIFNLILFFPCHEKKSDELLILINKNIHQQKKKSHKTQKIF
jgi:hypothetical protein